VNAETVTVNGEIDIVTPPVLGALEVVPLTLVLTLALLPLVPPAPTPLPPLPLPLPPSPPPPQALMSASVTSATMQGRMNPPRLRRTVGGINCGIILNPRKLCLPAAEGKLSLCVGNSLARRKCVWYD
jgi:hypothetical protein